MPVPVTTKTSILHACPSDYKRSILHACPSDCTKISILHAWPSDCTKTSILDACPSDYKDIHPLCLSRWLQRYPSCIPQWHVWPTLIYWIWWQANQSHAHSYFCSSNYVMCQIQAFLQSWLRQTGDFSLLITKQMFNKNKVYTYMMVSWTCLR